MLAKALLINRYCSSLNRPPRLCFARGTPPDSGGEWASLYEREFGNSPERPWSGCRLERKPRRGERFARNLSPLRGSSSYGRKTPGSRPRLRSAAATRLYSDALRAIFWTALPLIAAQQAQGAQHKP